MSNDKLQKIPLNYKDEYDYETTKECFFDEFNWFFEHSTIKPASAIQSVNNAYDDSFGGFTVSYIDVNGMKKFVAMLSGMLYMIEHNEVEADQAYLTNYDINDFETGEYDDLFTPEDLKLIKADIKVIKDYLNEHPELLEG